MSSSSRDRQPVRRGYSAAEALSAAAAGTEEIDLSVLVADDNVVNQELVCRILEKNRCSVAVASNGREAVGALLVRHFDLVIMDVQMPEMDGLQATAAIRSGMVNGLDAAVPIIAMSANCFPADRLKCLQAGMNEFVPKPLRVNELLAVVEKYRKATDVDPVVPAVNRKTVLDRLGDKELLELVCTAFLRDAPVHVERLAAALSRNDLKEVERHAHSLKGAAANVGAEDLRISACAMEIAAEEGRSTGLQRLLSDIRSLVEAAVKELQEG